MLQAAPSENIWNDVLTFQMDHWQPFMATGAKLWFDRVASTELRGVFS